MGLMHSRTDEIGWRVLFLLLLVLICSVDDHAISTYLDCNAPFAGMQRETQSSMRHRSCWRRLTAVHPNGGCTSLFTAGINWWQAIQGAVLSESARLLRTHRRPPTARTHSKGVTLFGSGTRKRRLCSLSLGESIPCNFLLVVRVLSFSHHAQS